MCVFASLSIESLPSMRDYFVKYRNEKSRVDFRPCLDAHTQMYSQGKENANVNGKVNVEENV